MRNSRDPWTQNVWGHYSLTFPSSGTMDFTSDYCHSHSPNPGGQSLSGSVLHRIIGSLNEALALGFQSLCAE